MPRAIRVDAIFPTVGLCLTIKGLWLKVSCLENLSEHVYGIDRVMITRVLGAGGWVSHFMDPG